MNQVVLDVRDSSGVARLGLMNNQVWRDDPRRLVFTLARYKFVSKMLSGRSSVLEIGCGDAFCARVVKQEVSALTVTDSDPIFVKDIEERLDARWPMKALVHDILKAPVPGEFDAAYSLDVLEHIPREHEDRLLENVKRSLTPHGSCIIGMPSLESQAYASLPSRAGHVNCKTGEDLRALVQKHFHVAFMFSMSDEVVHTGFFKMAHYLLAVCAVKK